jgi:hypothetical protein
MSFEKGNKKDGKHYWLTPEPLMAGLQQEFNFDFDPCPFPKPEDFDGLAVEWGYSNYVNPPFGQYKDRSSGKRKGPTAWARKALKEFRKGKQVVFVYPMDKWVIELLEAGARVRNLGNVKWHAIEDGSQGRGTGHDVAAFILTPKDFEQSMENKKHLTRPVTYQQTLFSSHV